ncbi:MAG TPA: hypothetical protein VKX28_18100 [Xanthobacteraceae bacterium]|jgi:uncharacterized membrane protein YhaH (DUF805 family)|nr:hypothetical protein [Xanthobacteraceae bacterium]
MWKSGKRLDRPTYWMWAVPLVAGHVILGLMMMSGTATSLGSIDTGLIIGLAVVLAARFRDIGWPAWIGPTILIGTMFGLPFLVLGIAAANGTGSRMMGWLSLYGLFSVPVNLILLIVAGSVPGKPEPVDVAHVFE